MTRVMTREMTRAMTARALRSLLAPLPLSAALAASGGCLGGASLEASLEAPAVELSARDAMKELRFLAEAHTSDAIAAGEVSVVVRALDDAGLAPGASPGGQVRVTVGRGESLLDDPAPNDEVVSCALSDAVAIPKDALVGCEGHCRQTFVAIFAAEGLGPDVTVSLPVVVEAQLVYENAIEAPPGDSLRLTLLPGSSSMPQ